MTPSLSCAVMAHKKREAMVDDLLSRLDRPVPVVWDRINDRHDTGARAMEAFDPSCSHHLVLQDDVLPSRDLIAGAERALKWCPQGVPVSLYIGRVRPFAGPVQKAVTSAEGASWITMQGIYWGPAVILPTSSIDSMLDWFRGPEGSTVVNYDRRMSVWYRMQNLDCWYSWPSLVDHRGEESLCGRRSSKRNAHKFHDGSALDVDWSGRVVEIPHTEAMDDERQTRAIRAHVQRV